MRMKNPLLAKRTQCEPGLVAFRYAPSTSAKRDVCDDTRILSQRHSTGVFRTKAGSAAVIACRSANVGGRAAAAAATETSAAALTIAAGNDLVSQPFQR